MSDLWYLHICVLFVYLFHGRINSLFLRPWSISICNRNASWLFVVFDHCLFLTTLSKTKMQPVFSTSLQNKSSYLLAVDGLVLPSSLFLTPALSKTKHKQVSINNRPWKARTSIKREISIKLKRKKLERLTSTCMLLNEKSSSRRKHVQRKRVTWCRASQTTKDRLGLTTASVFSFICITNSWHSTLIQLAMPW